MNPFVSPELGKSDVTRGFRPGAPAGLSLEGAAAFEPFLSRETGQIRAFDALPVLQVSVDSLTGLGSALENACILPPDAGTADEAADKANGPTNICAEGADVPIRVAAEDCVTQHGTGDVLLAATPQPIDPVGTMDVGATYTLTPQPLSPGPQQLETALDIAPQTIEKSLESVAKTPVAQGPALDDSRLQATGVVQAIAPRPMGVDAPPSPAHVDDRSLPVPETQHRVASVPDRVPKHVAPLPSSGQIAPDGNPDPETGGHDEGGKVLRQPEGNVVDYPDAALGETAAQANLSTAEPQDQSPAEEARPLLQIPRTVASGANATTDTSPQPLAGQEARDDTGNAVSAAAEPQTKAMPAPAQNMRPLITQPVMEPESGVDGRIPPMAEVPAPTVAEGGETTYATPPQRTGFSTPQASPAPTPPTDLPLDDVAAPITMPAQPSLDDRSAPEAPLGPGLPGVPRPLEAADPAPARIAFDMAPGMERAESTLPMTDRPAQMLSLTQNASGGAPTVFGAPASEVAQSIGRQMTVALAQPVEGSVELSLAPEELGKVRMTLHTTDVGITVSVHAERSETLDLMRRHIEQLARDFRELGYAAITFDFGNSAERRQGQLMQRDGQHAKPTPDLAPDLMPAAVRPSGSAAPSLAQGLDLRM
ncbi:flagellar hook-length control protein FliK [Phaeovulum sp. NW3]|uniref:flagellar hook-length control protein FliK n=1 Tax=Phaeovulum sp. NW3 TaxID=2934933 RepID=UPI002021D5F0|nr:flagellar hook-length control protein FliK [Phaeovulum sp. NW3]MCL7465255.1 flagellar hook-length control protein FliK [Phaeovulum sp. NW3]